MRKRYLPFWISALGLLALAVSMRSGTAAPEGPLRVTSITPAGTEVPPSRQIVFQFDRKVVPVGRMERSGDEIPITITPELDCEWRWLNTSALACQLGEDDAFRPATEYRVVVTPGITAEDGTELAEPVEHVFVTERPKIADVRFDRWLGPGTPRFRASFNQRVSEDEVEAHVAFETLDGKRFAVDAERPDETEVASEEPERYWMLRPVDELPLGAKVQLFVEPGLASLEGPLEANEKKLAVAVDTFPAHGFLGVRCRDNADNPLWIRPDGGAFPPRLCNPMAAVELVFASPVVKEVLKENLAIEPDLGGNREDYDPWEAAYSYSRLGWPRSAGQDYGFYLPELLHARTTYRLQAKAGDLLDEFGRSLPEDVDFLFTTDDRPPNAVLTHPTSTLEKNVETYVPVVVTNLSRLDVDVQALTASGTTSFTKTIELPEAPNVAFRFPSRPATGSRPAVGCCSGRCRRRPWSRCTRTGSSPR